MFTGLVEGLGRVAALERSGDGESLRLRIDVPIELVGARLGDSVAINGCCLTVVAIDPTGRAWSFDAGAETLSKTNLGRFSVGDPVNLERSLAVGARLGGHFVQGHVDGTGEVARIDRRGDWIDVRFRVPADLARLMVPKGSVAVDGVSLTLVDVAATEFSVALIPHTLAVTTLGVRRVGDQVNVETDILGKYVAKLLAEGDSSSAGACAAP